jgi:hypothetical protein
MDLERLLKLSRRDVKVLRRLQGAIRRRGLYGESIENTLDSYQLRNEYREAVISAEPQIKANRGIWIKHIPRLARIIREMGISVDELIDRCPFPFNEWTPGRRVTIYLGTRTGLLDQQSDPAASFSGVTDRDDQARTFLTDRLLADVDCKLYVERNSATTSYDEAQVGMRRTLDGCGRGRPRNHGAVIVIGAPPTNPMAEPLAQRILAGEPSPFQFRWSNRFPMSRFVDRPIVLSHRKNCPDQDEGLALSCSQTNTLWRRRSNVDPSRYSIEASDSYDCGMILMGRYPNPEGPRLILLAGHGASATLAATYALFHPDLRRHLVPHESVKGVEYCLIKVTSPKGNVQPDGRGCGWKFYFDPLLYDDEDIEVSRVAP